MVRTVIKLVIGLLLMNGAWRVGLAYYQFYEFQDAVQRVAQFAADVPTPSVHAQVMEIAKSLDVPVAEERVSVRKDQHRVYVDAVYSRPIEVVPRYRVPWEFTVTVTAMLLPRGK